MPNRFKSFCLLPTFLFLSLPLIGQAASYTGNMQQAPLHNDLKTYQRPQPGFYASIFGGAAFTPDFDVDIPSGSLSFSTGYDVGTTFGYKFEPISLRVEGEFTYMHSYPKNGELKTPVPHKVPLSGDIEAFSFMANLLYDFDMISPIISPYIGFGIGYTQLDWFVAVKNVGLLGSDSEGKFAYQALAGINFNVADNASIGIGYRYFRTTKLDDMNEPFQNHLLNVSYTYRF